MALFSKTTTKKAAPKKAKSAPAARAPKKARADKRHEGVLIAPYFSEKALIGTERGVYVFTVPADATKYDVAVAVEQIYKVVPAKVRIVNLPAKKVSLRSRRGTGSRARRHKAYVYLAKGETISFA